MSLKGKTVFQGSIIQKFMSAAEFEVFLSKYYANKGQGIGSRPTNDEDRAIFKDYKENKMRPSEISKKYACSLTRVNTAIMKAVLD